MKCFWAFWNFQCQDFMQFCIQSWFFCLYFSNVVINFSADFELELARISIENLEQLENFEVLVYSNVGILHSKMFLKCLKDLHDSNARICIGQLQLIHMMSDTLRKSKKMRGLRMTKLVVNSFYDSVQLRPFSPFSERFNGVILRVFGSGLMKSNREDLRALNLEFEDEVHDLVDSNELKLYYWLLKIIVFCHGIATIFLYFEVFHERFNRKVLEIKHNCKIWMKIGKKVMKKKKIIEWIKGFWWCWKLSRWWSYIYEDARCLTFIEKIIWPIDRNWLSKLENNLT